MAYRNEFILDVRSKLKIHAYRQGRGPEPFQPRSDQEIIAYILYEHKADPTLPSTRLCIGDLDIAAARIHFEKEKKNGVV